MALKFRPNFQKTAALVTLGLVGASLLVAFQNFSYPNSQSPSSQKDPNRFYKFVPLQGEDWPEPGDSDEAGADSGGGGADPSLYGGGSADTPDMSKIKTGENGSIDPSSFKDLISFGSN